MCYNYMIRVEDLTHNEYIKHKENEYHSLYALF